ncbi:MAG: phosphotransferase [candidate division KSB1 bacterium]|nr:phosphotransferase [candidate division KSB1 bacterium]
MKILEALYQKRFNRNPDTIVALRSDGSERKIYRVIAGDHSVIGIIGVDHQEAAAFLEFSRHFKKYGLRVPEIYIEDLDQGAYLEEDFGDETLFSWMQNIRAQHGFNDTIKDMYRQVVEYLPNFQIKAGLTLDYSYCYQHQEFGQDSMQWDLHYFKRQFLNYFYKKKINHTELDEDFNRLIRFLLQEERKYFLYRDYQSRNVMIKDGLPHFIDYQSGRRGALQYDLGSLLYDAKANLPEDFREELIDLYLDEAGQLVKINPRRFKKYFYGFVLIRIMQALGAYGYLSAVKGKTHFFKSVPFALRNLEILLDKKLEILDQLPTLKEIFCNLIQDYSLRQFSEDQRLMVQIYSFGYHQTGIPEDKSGNNGGFVFDCRFLPNPGREEQYKNLTGKDRPVVEYFANYPIVGEFLNHVYRICDMAVDNYQSRQFSNLMVSFGCTGGRHRSVYCAEKLAEYLKAKGVQVTVNHRSLEPQPAE